MTDPRAPYSAGFPATTTGRRYLSPTQRLQLRQARMDAVARGLDKCLAATRARILRGVRFRERGDAVECELLAPDPETVAAALEACGFECEVHGMLVRGRRRLKRQTQAGGNTK